MKPEAILHSNKDLKVVSHHITIHYGNQSYQQQSGNYADGQYYLQSNFSSVLPTSNTSNIGRYSKPDGGRINDGGKIL